MNKIFNLSIVLSFAGLWITSLLPNEYETLLGFIFIFTFGILHGSNDILLINSIQGNKINYTFFKVLTLYILTVLTTVIAFYIIPSLALMVFIVFSAFHFGEQHWENKNLEISKLLKNGLYFFYGLFILNLLFILNTKDVVDIIFTISSNQLDTSIITISFFISLIGFLALATYLYFKVTTFKKIIIQELFYLLVFTLIFKVSTLIWGFTIYFIFWHSIPSIHEQVVFIYDRFNHKNLLLYCKKAAPYWVISIVGMILLYFLIRNQSKFYAVFFALIAAVTFPHALIINKMFSNKKTQSP